MSSITAKTQVKDLPILQLEKRELISIIAHLIDGAYCGGNFHGYGFSDEEIEILQEVHDQSMRVSVNRCEFDHELTDIKIK